LKAAAKVKLCFKLPNGFETFFILFSFYLPPKHLMNFCLPSQALSLGDSAAAKIDTLIYPASEKAKFLAIIILHRLVIWITVP